MKSSLDIYMNSLNRLLHDAEMLDIPHAHLRHHLAEMKRYYNRQNCPHVVLKWRLRGNAREWYCSRCGKVIDVETIKTPYTNEK